LVKSEIFSTFVRNILLTVIYTKKLSADYEKNGEEKEKNTNEIN